MKFRIGRVNDPKPDDRLFETQSAAETVATLESYDDSVWAVWEHESGEILALVYQQQVFTP